MSANKAVVWDLDGVIVDSAAAHNASWAAMARDFSLPYDPDEDFLGIFGKHNTDIISSLWSVTDPDAITRMAATKERFFRQEAANLQPLPGVLNLMKALKQAGWKQAIGSSAPIENIQLLISATGTSPYIDAIASGDDVSRGKPDPEVFLLAFMRLGVQPTHGIVIEDAPAGVQAALRAGAACIAVATTQRPETLREAGAHMVVSSLTGLTVTDLEALVAKHDQHASGRRAESAPG